jgi:hypothetical protein
VVAVSLEFFIDHPSKTIELYTKSVLRILFGHANVEWGNFLIGEHVIGPSIFKPKEDRIGSQIKDGVYLILWIIFVLFFAIISLFEYKIFFQVFKKLISKMELVFLSIVLLLFVASPIFWGDSRFRLPIFATLMALAYFKRVSIN